VAAIVFSTIIVVGLLLSFYPREDPATRNKPIVSFLSIIIAIVLVLVIVGIIWLSLAFRNITG